MFFFQRLTKVPLLKPPKKPLKSVESTFLSETFRRCPLKKFIHSFKYFIHNKLKYACPHKKVEHLTKSRHLNNRKIKSKRNQGKECSYNGQFKKTKKNFSKKFWLQSDIQT